MEDVLGCEWNEWVCRCWYVRQGIGCLQSSGVPLNQGGGDKVLHLDVHCSLFG